MGRQRVPDMPLGVPIVEDVAGGCQLLVALAGSPEKRGGRCRSMSVPLDTGLRPRFHAAFVGHSCSSPLFVGENVISGLVGRPAGRTEEEWILDD